MQLDNPSYRDLYVDYVLDIRRLRDMLDAEQDPKRKTSISKSISNCKRMLDNLIAESEAAGESIDE